VTKVQQDLQKDSVSKIEPVKPPIQRNSSNDKDLNSRLREVLVPIYFDYNKYSLQNSEIQKLEKIASFLNENTNIRIMIEGHCDERGSSEYNMGLGENRARAVQKWLVAYGISQSRLEITSFGKERPASYGCMDENCHAGNRRDEWKILSIS
jgi:peptidoglycan-associated lipoprotein